MTKLASIDIGSNTIRLLILEKTGDGNFREINSARVIARLGEGINDQKRLLDHRIEKAVEVLAEFKSTCQRYGEIPIHAVATSAVREASNKDEFLSRVRDQTGLEIEVIPWEEEARLTLQGVLWKFPDKKQNILTFDIGGGSTEFIFSQGKKILRTAGTSLGVVRLTEKFISQHPVDENEYRRLTDHIGSELESVRSQLDSPEPDVLIGTAGTVTTLAALDQNLFPYDPVKIHGATLTRETISRLQEDLKGKSLEERLLLKPLERGREDLIIAGTALVLETMKTFTCEQLTVSEYALREGIILKALNSI